MPGTAVGVVSALRRYPVKSMLGESLSSAAVSAGGIAGDRAFALIDDETGKIVSAKRPKLWRGMFDIAATTNDDGRVVVELPGESPLPIDNPELPKRLRAYFGRRVSIAATPPDDALIDEAWEAELKNDAEPYFGAPTTTEGDEVLVDAGTFVRAHHNFFDFGAIHAVTTSTLRRLAELEPGREFDLRRFRPNIVIDADDEGFVENAWQRRVLSIGDVQLRVSIAVPRCVMTTLAQRGLAADRGVLRAITEHNGLDVVGTGTLYPCVGVYADVVAGGEIRVGDRVELSTPN